MFMSLRSDDVVVYAENPKELTEMKQKKAKTNS